jgi:2-polyprenyl-3-methyl-5-hydroxy-6-metoxy-1,4-benzoquinol methylase
VVLYIIHKVKIFRKLYFYKIGRPFVQKKIKPILPYLHPSEKILDIGSGNGLVAYLLRQKGLDITPIDIHEGNYHPSVKPIVYDGKHIPFQNQHFDTGIILTVLHHIEQPEIVLQEAARVCKHLIVMEDIYENALQKQLTFFLDKVANLFYSPCPHTNKSDRDWKLTFKAYDLELTAVHYRYVIGVVKQGIYVLRCK